jgi:hypothetical protein
LSALNDTNARGLDAETVKAAPEPSKPPSWQASSEVKCTEQMKRFNSEPVGTNTSSVTIAQPSSGRVPKTVKLAAAFELLLAPLLVWGNFPYIPFGNTIGLLLLGSVSLWLRGSGWRAIGLQRPRSWVKTLAWGIGLGIASQGP